MEHIDFFIGLLVVVIILTIMFYFRKNRTYDKGFVVALLFAIMMLGMLGMCPDSIQAHESVYLEQTSGGSLNDIQSNANATWMSIRKEIIKAYDYVKQKLPGVKRKAESAVDSATSAATDVASEFL